MNGPHCFIGTSGWIYKHWKDIFYAGVKQDQWLPFFAAHFETVEVNNYFYRKPTPAAVQSLSPRTPEGFVFAVKMWRGITHYRKLKDATDLLDKFMPLIHRIPAPRRGPLLVQLPRMFGRNVERLDSFLHDLGAWMHRNKSHWRIAVEFRNPDWLVPQVAAVLDRHGAAMALADMPNCPITRPNDVDFVYVRRHGGRVPGGGYEPAQIRDDARAIGRWLKQGREVFVYYNNDMGGFALRDADSLIKALGPLARSRTASATGLTILPV